jgi:hypothetical protein
VGSTQPIINKQWMRIRLLMAFLDMPKILCMSGKVMQPDYVGKPGDLYLWCLIGESKTYRQYACPMSYSCGCDTGRHSGDLVSVSWMLIALGRPNQSGYFVNPQGFTKGR